MKNIDVDVDEVDDREYLAVRVSAVLEERGEGPEEWRVELVTLGADEEPSTHAGAVLATAVAFRAHFSDDHWFDQMDSYDQQLASVSEEFIDREIIDAIDENSSFASGLVVVYYIAVSQELRRREFSHKLVRAIGRVFRSDIVALEPDGYAVASGAEIVEDDLKLRAEQRHWGEIGFIKVPDTRVMMLPLGARE